MGCTDDRSGPEVTREVMKQRLDKVTSLLCEAAGKLKLACDSTTVSLAEFAQTLMGSGLSEWYEQHLKEDIEQQRREIRVKISHLEAEVVQAVRDRDNKTVDQIMDQINMLHDALSDLGEPEPDNSKWKTKGVFGDFS